MADTKESQTQMGHGLSEKIISVLFLAADPTDATRLRLGEEFREIDEQLKIAKHRDHFKLELPQLSLRPKDISGALLNAQPQIVHFSGHGTAEGALCFENMTGESHLVHPDALAALFEQFADRVNCVLLNACYSEIQANAIGKHIDNVIGMNKAISDKAAIAFAIGFYQALGAGRTIEEAYKLGCVQIRLQNIPEHLTPVLIRRGYRFADDKAEVEKKRQQTESDVETPPTGKFHGRQRSEFLNFFTADWLPRGPAVAILQGFPGCGKTQLALAVAAKSPNSLNPIAPESASQDSSMDLLKALAMALNNNGIPDVWNELDKGADSNLFNALLRVLRREKILIIIDEFQRLFTDKDTHPPDSWQHLVENLNNSVRPAGRLLLISNRYVKTSPWCERCVIKELNGLTDSEAANFLQELLKSRNLTSKVPTERLEEISHRLGGNPRALMTLVGNLICDSIDDLFPLAPDFFKPGDVKIDHDLVEDFERQLIERTLSRLDVDLLKFMRWMAVHRRPFWKEAFSEFPNTPVPHNLLGSNLFTDFCWWTPQAGMHCIHWHGKSALRDCGTIKRNGNRPTTSLLTTILGISRPFR